MINKFKDFLKKLSRKKTDDLIDQEEISDQELSEDGSNEDLPDAAPVLKKSWKDKFLAQLNIQPDNRKDSDGDSDYNIAIGSPRQVRLIASAA